MKLTSQQEAIVNHVKEDTSGKITLVSSVAGSGKTTLLVAIANAIPHSAGLYLAYNKAIATESTKKFPSSTSCVTTHALAYSAIVRPNNYTLGYFGYRDIKGSLSYFDKLSVVDHLRGFCLSKHLTVEDYAEALEVSSRITRTVKQYLQTMEQGAIPCTHDFYLKMLHLQLAAGSVTYEEFDFIMLDEAGDLNEVTLEIFKLLPSKRKIAVGDPYQNIYAFNHTINCFKVLKADGVFFNMSTSFRVNEQIAKNIQVFCRNTMDPEMEFIGVPTDKVVMSEGVITKTNPALIGHMLSYVEAGTDFGLARKAKEIFKVPLMLASLKVGGFISIPEYAYLQKEFERWHTDTEIRHTYATPLAYLGSVAKEDYQVAQSVRLIMQHGKATLFALYKEAQAHEKKKCTTMLTTAHSAKGLEMDKVVIDESLNIMMTKVYEKVAKKQITKQSREYLDAINLYYVACSRAKKVLLNARFLTIPPPKG